MAHIGMTLGEKFGEMIMQVAVEKLQNNDPKGAMSVFLDNFPGMDDDTAFRLLTGSLVMDTAENGLDVNVRERDWDEDVHPYFEVDYFVSKYYNTFFEKAGYFTYEEHFLHWMQRLGDEQYITFKINSPGLFNLLYNEDFAHLIKDSTVSMTTRYFIDLLEANTDEWLEEFIELSENSGVLKDFLIQYKAYRDTYTLLQKMSMTVDFLIEKGWDFSYSEKERINSVEVAVKRLEKQWDAVKLTTKSRELATTLASGRERINQYCSEKNLVEEYVKDIEPVSIEKKYDAYWVSQDGEAYGCNGTTALWLHLQMAGAICEKKGYKSRNGDDSSRTLERLGWLKIHHDWVLYNGYDDPARLGRPLPISESQIRFLKEYSLKHSNGKLKFGYCKEERTVENIADFEYEKLLSL